MDIENKIKKAVRNKQLKLVAGKRKWRNFHITIVELVWGRNLWDGYEIHVYTEEYGQHLVTVII